MRFTSIKFWDFACQSVQIVLLKAAIFQVGYEEGS